MNLLYALIHSVTFISIQLMFVWYMMEVIGEQIIFNFDYSCLGNAKGSVQA
jgi:hypothetical protein